MYEKGQIVYSKCGRDKRKPFVIINSDDDFVYLVDGNLRKLQKPKKKKKKHIQISNEIDYNIKEKLEGNLYILDSDFIKSLKNYQV